MKNADWVRATARVRRRPGVHGYVRFYGPASFTDSVRLIQKAVDLGINFSTRRTCTASATMKCWWDKPCGALRGRVIVASKFGPDAARGWGALGRKRPAGIRNRRLRHELESALGLDVIDLYYQHRVDPAVPIEGNRGRHGGTRTGGQRCAFWDCRRPGAQHHSPRPRRAPHCRLQSEYSLWTRDPEGEILKNLPGAGHRLRRLQPLGPRPAHRPIPLARPIHG